MRRHLKVVCGGFVVAAGLVAAAHTVVAFSLLGQRWATGHISIELGLGESGGLFDGSVDWNACARQSLSAWNAVLAPAAMRFTADHRVSMPPVSFDGINSIAFATDVFGTPFGPSLISVTQSFAMVRDGLDETIEADVLLNRAQPFNCYRGAPPSGSSTHDLQRTVTHALGHVIGLAHPEVTDRAVPALMHAGGGDVETLQLNDIQGALTLVGVAMVGIPFPPRDEALTFYESLETEYRDTLQRTQTNQGYVDAEGSAVWFPEWLRYVLNGCEPTEAATRVLMQIRGQGVQPVCSEVAPGAIAFPPRNQSLDFLRALDAFYRDELGRTVQLSYVDLEGKAVWLQEYLRFRVDGASEAAARGQVLQQIRASAPAPEPPPAAFCAAIQYGFTDLGLVFSATDVGQVDPLAPVANPSALLLADGRVRLFFTNAGSGIGSAISNDGVTFAYEGIRISGRDAREQGAPLGPSRIFRLPDGRVRLYVGSSESGVSSFISSDDGVTFTLETGERITQAQAQMDAIQKLSIVALAGGVYRGYFGPAPQSRLGMTSADQSGPPDNWLRSATSSDLLQWDVEPGVLIGPGAAILIASAREVDPVLRNDGCLTLFYQLNKPEDAGITDFEGVAVVGYSTSNDGLSFTEQFPLITTRDPAGPDVLTMPDGSWLFYHDSTDPDDYGNGIRVGRLTTTSPE